jgi:hypothetical protein
LPKVTEFDICPGLYKYFGLLTPFKDFAEAKKGLPSARSVLPHPAVHQNNAPATAHKVACGRQATPAQERFRGGGTKLQDKLISVTRINAAKQVDSSVIHFDHQSIATYRSAQGLFLKYPLIMGDSLPTAPLLLYERISGKKTRSLQMILPFP